MLFRSVRRHPDIRWLRRETDLRGFAKTQAQMLAALWRLLAKGGQLLYTTCSVFPEENTDVINDFLRVTPDAKLRPLERLESGQILPNADEDGFYYALLQRGSP